MELVAILWKGYDPSGPSLGNWKHHQSLTGRQAENEDTGDGGVY